MPNFNRDSVNLVQEIVLAMAVKVAFDDLAVQADRQLHKALPDLTEKRDDKCSTDVHMVLFQTVLDGVKPLATEHLGGHALSGEELGKRAQAIIENAVQVAVEAWHSYSNNDQLPAMPANVIPMRLTHGDNNTAH